MHTEFTLNLATVYAFLLVLARVSGIIAIVPIPGLAAGPDTSRVVLAVVLTVALLPASSLPSTGTPTLAQLTGWIASEAAFGLTVGVAIAFLLEGVQLAAQMIGLQAGYSFASTIDPTTQADTTTLQVLAQLLAGSLFFALGLDRQIILVLARSFQSIPPGGFGLDRPAAEAMVRLGSGIFSTGLRLALPVLALMILLDLAFGILGRLHAQLQLLSFTFAIKMLVALAFLATILSLYPAVFEQAAATTFTMLAGLLSR